MKNIFKPIYNALIPLLGFWLMWNGTEHIILLTKILSPYTADGAAFIITGFICFQIYMIFWQTEYNKLKNKNDN